MKAALLNPNTNKNTRTYFFSIENCAATATATF